MICLIDSPNIQVELLILDEPIWEPLKSKVTTVVDTGKRAIIFKLKPDQFLHPLKFLYLIDED